MKNKKLLGILGITALLLAGNFAWREAKEVDAAGETKTYFIDFGVWDDDPNAWFQAYAWGNDSWHNVTDNDHDGIWEVTIPTTKTGMKFVRKGPDHAANAWQSWNESNDINLSNAGSNNKLTFTGWNSNNFNLSTYSATVSLKGSLTNWESGTSMAKNGNEFSLELFLGAGEYKFKLFKDGSKWLSNDGSIVDTTTTSSQDGWDMSTWSSQDCTLEATGGKYLFVYNLETCKLEISHTSYSDMLSELVEDYVGDKTYTKKTVINLDQNSDELTFEFSSLFHANKVPTLDRTTYYNGDSLWMDTNSGYGTAEDGRMNHFTVDDNGKAKVDYFVNKDHANWSYTDVNGMEGFYVTPYDFIEEGYFDGWTYNSTSNVYSLNVTNSDPIVSDFINVVAPLLLSNVIESNYIVVTSLVAKETEAGLILQIIASNDTGKLVGGTDVLAEATITKDCTKTWTF